MPSCYYIAGCNRAHRCSLPIYLKLYLNYTNYPETNTVLGKRGKNPQTELGQYLPPIWSPFSSWAVSQWWGIARVNLFNNPFGERIPQLEGIRCCNHEAVNLSHVNNDNKNKNVLLDIQILLRLVQWLQHAFGFTPNLQLFGFFGWMDLHWEGFD